MLGRQEEEADAARVGGVGQHRFERTAGRAPSGRVTVEAEHHLVGEAKQLLRVLGRAGGAQGGHGVAISPLCQRHHVHIAFGDDGVALVAQGGAAFEQAIQLTPLDEHGRFG